MSAWRRIALEAFPECRQVIETENVFMLWIELWMRFDDAYREDDMDEAFIKKVYQYSRWCLSTRGGYIASAAVVCFYENLPTNRHAREDLPRWLSIEDFERLLPVFGYFLGPDEIERFKREFYQVKGTQRGFSNNKKRS